MTLLIGIFAVGDPNGPPALRVTLFVLSSAAMVIGIVALVLRTRRRR